jgi:hypothetical protein
MTIDYFLRTWIPLKGKPKLTVQLITVSKTQRYFANLFK